MMIAANEVISDCLDLRLNSMRMETSYLFFLPNGDLMVIYHGNPRLTMIESLTLKLGIRNDQGLTQREEYKG